jgi:hypothetical protein
MAVAKMTVGSIVAVCWRYGERRLLAGTEEKIHLSGQIVGLLERSQPARAIHKNAAVGKVLPILDVSLSASILARRTLSRPCSTIVEYLPPCGGSMPEPAGGVRRRFGKGLLTGHHFRKQPPGDRSERETVMGMAKGEP